MLCIYQSQSPNLSPALSPLWCPYIFLYVCFSIPALQICSSVLLFFLDSTCTCYCDGNVTWYSHYGEQYGGSLKKLMPTYSWNFLKQCDQVCLESETAVKIAQSCLTLWDPMDCSLSCPVNLPDPGIKPGSPALKADSLPTKLPGNSGEFALVFCRFCFPLPPLSPWCPQLLFSCGRRWKEKGVKNDINISFLEPFIA